MDSELRRLYDEAAEEAAIVELIDRVEAQAAELTQLRRELEDVRAERDRLETELVMARSWLKELARWVEEAQANE